MSDHIVTENAMRPASTEKRCFYCQEPIGKTHLDDCVLIKRKVRIEMTVEYDVLVPASWDAYQIESHRNDGSWCASNAIEELRDATSGNDCLCGVASFSVLSMEQEAVLEEV